MAESPNTLQQRQPSTSSNSAHLQVPLLQTSGKALVPSLRGIVMEPLIWHKVAAISGIAAIGLGTYGAHAFKPANPAFKEVWHTANLYHMVHTTALLAAPLTKRPHVFGSLLTFGIIAFSGTCYMVALNEDRKLSKPAPYGGVAFLAAWASLLF